MALRFPPAVNSRRLLRSVQPSFEGGLNTSADESQLQPNEVRRAQNARLTEFGGVTKCKGSQRVSAAAIGSGNPVRGGLSWDNAGTVSQLAVSNGLLHTGTHAIPMTWTAQVGGLSSAVQVGLAAFRDGTGNVAYLADGGPLNKWDGTTLTVNIASTPNATVLAVYNQRLFGITGSDETLYWSALNNGDSLGIAASGGGSAVVRTFGKSTLTGLLPLGSSLMLFHKGGISRFTGWTQDDISIATGTLGVSSDVGTIAPGSIVAVENVGYFLSDRGVYELTEGGVNPISGKIESVIQGLDHSLFSRVVAAHHKAYKEVWFYLPDTGVYIWNYRLRQWTGPRTGLFTDQTPYSMWPAVDSSSKPILLAGFGDGFVRQIDVSGKFRDDYTSAGASGSAFTMVVKCHRMFAGTPTREKAWRWIHATANLRGSTTAALQYTTATASETVTLPPTDSDVWGAGDTWTGTDIWGGYGSATARIQASGRGPFIDITISDEGDADSVWSRIEPQGYDMGQRG